MATQRNWFAVVTAAIGLVLGTLLVVGRSPAWYLMPVMIAVGTYVLARRLRKGTEAQITRHVYGLSAKGATARVVHIVEKLGQRGYQPEVRTLNEMGEEGPPAGSETELVGAQLKVVEKRGGAELGMLTLRMRKESDGAIAGLLEADDTGPGVYDEMAQFLILELAPLMEGLHFVKMGANAERRPATDLRAELPDSPYGLGLL